MLQCPIKQNFGVDCPGCGMQRSLLLLIQGDLGGALRIYPAMIGLLLMFLLLGLHLKFNFKQGAEILKYLFIFNALTIFLNYIIKHL